MIPPGKQIFSKIVNRVMDLAYDRVKGSAATNKRALTYDVVFPQIVSKENPFPSHITPPKYALGDLEDVPMNPILKTDVEVKLMRTSCRLAKKMLNAAKKKIKVGLTTDELDKYIHDLIIKNQAYPSPLRYQDFPKSICTSVNNIVVHGIPDSRPLKNGDIITVDVTVFYQGYHGDCAATFLVGDVDDEGQYLVQQTESILMKAISMCKPGTRISMIAKTVTTLAQRAHLRVIPCVYGHGIGQYFHELPAIEHFFIKEHYEDFFPSKCYTGEHSSSYKIDEEPIDAEDIMLPGMTFTIEPVLGTGSQETELYDDGWTLATADDSRTAQFEHTILITNTGAEILTK